MKILLLYTLARAALFAVTFGLIWLVIGTRVDWDAVSGLYTALIAMVISSLIALVALRGLRARAAAALGTGVERVKASRVADPSEDD